MDKLSKIIITLSNSDLSLKLLCYAGDSLPDIYTLHREFTKKLVNQLPFDKYYIMDNNGDIPFIGNLELLNTFCNNLNKELEK